MNNDTSQEVEKKSRFKVKNVVPGDITDTGSIEKASLHIGQDLQSLAASEQKSSDSTLKKSRFTVKTVPKEDEKQSLNANQNNQNNSDIVNIMEYMQQQSKAIQKIERMVELNCQMLHKFVDTKNALLTDATHQGRPNETELPMSVQVKEKPIPRDYPSDSQQSSIQASHLSVTAKDSDKEKGLGKMSHYLTEVKKEVDSFQKQRKEMQLEMQRLREKCQQLEDQLSVEQSKVINIEDRLERSKTYQRGLQAQIEAQNLKLDRRQSLLEAQNQAIPALGTAVHDQFTVSTDRLPQPEKVPTGFSQSSITNTSSTNSLGSNKSTDNIHILNNTQNKESSNTLSRPLRSLSFDTN